MTAAVSDFQGKGSGYCFRADIAWMTGSPPLSEIGTTGSMSLPRLSNSSRISRRSRPSPRLPMQASWLRRSSPRSCSTETKNRALPARETPMPGGELGSTGAEKSDHLVQPPDGGTLARVAEGLELVVPPASEQFVQSQ